MTARRTSPTTSTSRTSHRVRQAHRPHRRHRPLGGATLDPELVGSAPTAGCGWCSAASAPPTSTTRTSRATSGRPARPTAAGAGRCRPHAARGRPTPATPAPARARPPGRRHAGRGVPPRAATIYYQVGARAGPDFTVADCCAYDVTLVQDAGVVYAAWYANGDGAANMGEFVRTIYPTLGPIIQVPGSVSTFSGNPARSPTRRTPRWRPATAAVSTSPSARATPSATASCCGSTAPPSCSRSRARKGASHVAISPAPLGSALDRLRGRRRRPARRAHQHDGEEVRGRAHHPAARVRRTVYKIAIEGTRGPRRPALQRRGADLAPAALSPD